MRVVKVSSRGQIVVPKEIREKLGIKPGTRVLFQVVEQHAEIVPLPQKPVKALRGMLKSESSLAAELLEERRQAEKGVRY
ncbi:MAG TPA: AbrB/MazE/SpoVT family DNA-binding domain-containing protein [Syntrophobacteraceae bacterium]|nr:AbrB/MazE/SpoVT family DNA-binding domain-containing protein [Syntrophobacteraceae bacterium]